MSWSHGLEPICDDLEHAQVKTVIEGRPRDIGAFTVRRVLPSRARRMVGPFIFFDQMGPADIPPGSGMNVRPHPHINLATITYLFEGEILHRDSLGSERLLQPGALNWMVAGRGIVHSEQTPQELRVTGSRMHGLQLWVALPSGREEVDPSFAHYPMDAIPTVDVDGVHVRVLAGNIFGAISPLASLSPLFYVDAAMPRGSTLRLAPEFPERAAFIVSGALRCGEQRFEVGQMLVFDAGCMAQIHADEETKVILIGGEPLDGVRHIWWNFVSSSKERIEKAKTDWAEGPSANGHFPRVPGNTDEFIPLPD